LVIPEVNGHALERHRGIVACPNCTTTGLVMAIEPLRRAAGLRSLVVTTLQAVSGAGRDACAEFDRQRRAWGSGEPGEAPRSFPRPIADNVIAQCGAFEVDGYTTEEHKLLAETRKILELPRLEIAATAVRVPVEVGHSASVLVETETELDVALARQAYAGFPGVTYIETEAGPTPLDVIDNDDVLVGRLRRDFGTNRLWLWEVSNNLRKGAATNAVQIAEALSAGAWSFHAPASADAPCCPKSRGPPLRDRAVLVSGINRLATASDPTRCAPPARPCSPAPVE
jgi:aspartate-semialdehyde dehydrogenase